MSLLAEFKGQNGILYIHNDYIEISRKSLGGLTSQGGKGNRKFYYADISAIEYKTPTFFGNGYFKIIISGTKDIDAAVGLLSSSMESLKDPNTVVLRAFKKSTSNKCDQIHSIALKQLDINKESTALIKQSTNSHLSNLDELKKLGDLLSSGVLTREEFQKEKEKLLV